jgi:hypothetical protein
MYRAATAREAYDRDPRSFSPEVSMVRFLARLLGIVIGASIVAGIASSIAALRLKQSAPPRPDAAADEIDLVVVMDGTSFASTAPTFRGGRVISWYAGTDVDLREAKLDPTGAHLEIRTVFAGTRVVVAPGVPVRTSGPAIFGGVMKPAGAAEPTSDTPGLEIGGCTVFGGLQIVVAEQGEEIPFWTPGRPAEPETEPAG